jgi:hypothetical protein
MLFKSKPVQPPIQHHMAKVVEGHAQITAVIRAHVQAHQDERDAAADRLGAGLSARPLGSDAAP